MTYATGHGFTPGRFSPDHCQVQLARYPCPYTREEHDPGLKAEDLDVFGRRRRPIVPPVTAGWDPGAA